MSYRVLICRSNPVDPDPRVEKIARTLIKAGYKVEIIAWDRTGAMPRVQTWEQITLHRLPIRSAFATGMGNLVNLLKWQIGLFFWLIKNQNRFDIIHACDFDTVVPAVFCKGVFGKKVVYDIFDFYADHLRNTPGFIKRIIIFLDLKVIRWVDAVILVDDARLEQLRGVIPLRWTSIYNSPEDDDGVRKNPLIRPGESQLHLVYVGLLQVERGLFDIFDILRRHPEWTMAIAGYGGDEDKIVGLAAQLPNVTWHGRIPYERALALSSSADVLFAIYDPAIPNHKYSSANKLFEAMMLAKPLVVAEKTNMDRIVLENNCGLVVSYGIISELEAAFEKLSHEPEYRLQLGLNAREAFDKIYSWSIMEQKLLDFYSDILNN